MYQYNEAGVLDPNGANTTVPNVMFDGGADSFGKIEVQEGANYSMPGAAPTATVGMAEMGGGAPTQTMPVYAIDTSVQQFEIPDPIARRAFARKVFIIILLQHIIALPIVEVFMLCVDEPVSLAVVQGCRGLMFCICIAFYFFSDFRRYPPMNIVAFVLITLMVAAEEGMLATWLHSQLAIFPNLIIIVQLLAIVGYSEQTRYKFSNINAIFLILLISVAGHYLVQIVYPMFSSFELSFILISLTTYRAAYIVYDMQLMLSGHHGYNLQANEHFFGATNIYADFPNLSWRIFKFVIITPLVKIYQFFVSCCFAEVC